MKQSWNKCQLFIHRNLWITTVKNKKLCAKPVLAVTLCLTHRSSWGCTSWLCSSHLLCQIDYLCYSLSVCVMFDVNLTQLELSGKRKLNWENVLIRWPIGKFMGQFLVNGWWERAAHWMVVPQAGGLEWYKKVGRENHREQSKKHLSLIYFCGPQWSGLVSQINPFFLKLFLSISVYHSNKKQSRT